LRERARTGGGKSEKSEGRSRNSFVDASEAEAIVFLVRPDPEPSDHVAFPHSDGTAMLADADDANSVAPFLKT